jgi:DNA polymerase-3 subunit delta'
MAFAAIQGQEAALTFLRRALERGRIPGAFLFLGPHHVGKRGAALALAKALNCEQPPDGPPDACDACPSCRKIDAAVHPDVVTVEPDGQFIKIDQVREVTDLLALNPALARRRVVVLAEAERMNPQAANAFLKTLEEPPADTLIVLCADAGARLPPTIVSRCVPVRFGPLPEPVLRALFSAAGKGAAPAGATLDFAVRFAQGRARPELREKFTAWLALRDDMLHLLGQGGGPGSLGDRPGKWAASGDWAFVLEWLETALRDLAWLAAGGGAGRLINVDRADALAALSAGLAPRAPERGLKAVLATRAALQLNANKTLALETLWTQMHQLCRRTAA